MTAVDSIGEDDGVFVGETEMARRCRDFDWAASPLGPVAQWPDELRTAVRLMLIAPVPTSLWCGAACTLMYNDAYRAVLGAKHPDALGRSGAEVWAELWSQLEPQLRQVQEQGASAHVDEARLTGKRAADGRDEDAWFTFSFSPVADDRGACLAVYGVAVDITGLVSARDALASERARLFEAFQRVPSFVSVVTGADHVFEYANEAYYQLVGRRDIIGRPVWDAIPDARGQGFEALLDSVRDTGVPVVGREAPVRLVRTPGAAEELRYVDFVYQALTNADGSRWAVMSVGTDVTDHVEGRRAMERLLAESEQAREDLAHLNAQLQDQQVELEITNEQLQENAVELELQSDELQATAAQLEERTEEAEEQREAADAERARAEGILEAMADAHFVLDDAFRFLSVNSAMARAARMSRDAVLGHSIWDLFPGIVGTDVERHYRHVAAEGVEAHFTHDYSDGRLEIVADVDAYPTADNGVAVFWRDVSERARMEEARRSSENQLRTFADAIPTLAWTARPDGYIDWYNARWYEYTGTTPEQMAGWGWQSVHDSTTLPDVLERWQGSIASGTPFEMTFPLLGADGRFRPFLTRVVPFKDSEGRVVRWFGTNTDVEAERAAREAAEDANRTKTDFLATMSHELRTPLNAIGGYTELLEVGIHGPVTDQQRDTLGRIQRSQRHLLGLINDVLNFAKLEAGRVEYHVADVPVRVAVDELEPLVAPLLSAKTLRFSREDCADGRVVRADPEKLQQILLNLLSNAIKFTPAGGAVTMHCDDAGDVVHIRVRDTGIGIAAERLEHVFAPFVQVHRRLNAPHEGTGLGLAISRDLARGMGGDLTAESVPGVGSTFVLTLARAGAAGG